MSALWLIAVAFLWGGTNPWLKKGAEGDLPNSFLPILRLQWLRTLIFFLLKPSYIIPLLLNLSGSVLYYLTLRDMDLKLAVPITNSLTFVMTTLMGVTMGEPWGGPRMALGMLLVVIGVAMCINAS